jgi:hypothetical protein
MNKRLYSIYLIDGGDNKRIEPNTKVVTPHISINVDSRSTQNFINSRIFYRLQCSLVTIRPLLVKAANKGTIICTTMCKNFKWRIQDNSS